VNSNFTSSGESAESGRVGRAVSAGAGSGIGPPKLCPDEKMVGERRCFDVQGCGGIEKSCQSHPVI
jgi:hypothetical protein